MKNRLLRTGLPVYFFLNQGEGGGGAGGGEGAKTYSQAEIDAAYERGKNTHGGVEAFARHLYNDNFEQREQIRQLRESLPPDNWVMLTPEEAEMFEEYKKHGKPEEINQLKEAKVKLEQETALAKRETLLRDVADGAAPGVKLKFSVLKDLDSRTPGLTYSQEEVEVEGSDDKVKVWMATYKEGEGDAATTHKVPLTSFIDKKWEDYKPALLIDASQTQQPITDQGIVYPDQPAGSKAPTTSFSQQHMQSKYGHALPKSAANGS